MNYSFPASMNDALVVKNEDESMPATPLKELAVFDDITDSEGYLCKGHTGDQKIALTLLDGTIIFSESYLGARPPHR